MSEVERLRAWMTQHNYNTTKLAAETGMSLSGVHQILCVRKRVSPGFKLRFIGRFGVAVANEIFDTPVAVAPETA